MGVGAAALLAVLAMSASVAAAAAPPPLTLPQCGDFGGVHICSGEVPSFDGSKLDVDLTFPTTGGTRHPLMVMLHGFGNNKHEWESTTDQGDNGDKYHWNNKWFAEHGYYVLNYTARGFRDDGRNDPSYEPNTPNGTSVDLAATGNPNDSGTIHVKSRDFEIHDTQWLAALVAANIADVDPNAVAVTGGSYGGGESWLQASQSDWTFPNSQDPSLPVLKLQVAVPKYPWTDLSYALTPNGHGGGPSGNDIYESSQGAPTSDTGDGNPIGTPKQSWLEALYAVGVARGVFEQYTTSPADPAQAPEGPVNLGCWQFRINGSPPPTVPCAPPDDPASTGGDPYDVAGVEDATVRRVRRGFTEFRSSYYQDEGFATQVGQRKVAVFSISGWTDDLFEVVESFRQFKYLKRLDPNWPVEVQVADVGHSRAQNKPATWHRVNDQAWQWLQSNINGSHDQQTTVASEPTLCADGSPPNNLTASERLTATTPEGLSNGSLTITYDHGGRTDQDSGSGDPDGVATDPIVGRAVDTALTGSEDCRAATALPYANRYTAVSAPLPRHMTYIGLGDVDLHYALVGVAATLAVRVWDVAPSGGPTLLITRGTYRIDTPAYDSTPTGFIRLPLYGNHWPLAPGHRIRLDIVQDESPYLRRSNLPSSVSFDPPVLRMPLREAAGVSLDGSATQTGP